MLHALLHAILVLWEEHRGDLVLLLAAGIVVLLATMLGSGGPGPPLGR